MIVLPAKLVAEKIVYNQFDFTSRMSAGETISSASMAASVYSGTDPSPGAILSGPVTISGNIVEQTVINGVLGVVYELLATANTSLGQILELPAYLTIVPDLP
jgi:hypothetical protein